MVLLEHAPAGLLILEGVRESQTAQPTGTARIIKYENTEVTVETDSPSAALLVLADVWHPWWRVEVDGAPSEILKADVLFRAVAASAGRHTVRFTFRPFSGALAELMHKLK
jgi:hypothetical protein